MYDTIELFSRCSLKRMPRYNWNIVESGAKHHKPETECSYLYIFASVKNDWFVFNVNVVSILAYCRVLRYRH